MNETVESILEQIREKQMDEESKGIIFLTGGNDVFVGSHFYTMKSVWLMYKRAINTGEEQLLSDIYNKYTASGVLTNGQSFLDLDSIVGMVEVDDEEFFLPED